MTLIKRYNDNYILKDNMNTFEVRHIDDVFKIGVKKFRIPFKELQDALMIFETHDRNIAEFGVLHGWLIYTDRLDN